ncbi:MAG: thiamine diphosphokinase [bacterium]|nr:thiamine diphosphokinase [bacterium]
MDSNPTETNSVLVIAGGDPWSGPLPHLESSISRVIAADSGVELALQLGLPVSVVIGDMDSASPESLAEAQRGGARIDRHPRDKDATDLELALDLARSDGATSIIVIGGAGGRVSHFLGNAALLGSTKYADMTIRWLLPGADIHVVNSLQPAVVSGQSGDLLSLIPLGGACGGVTATALRWSLDHDDLTNAATRGLSNEMLTDQTQLSVEHGTLLAIHERPPV